jgi:predicted DNA-binding transcriptional regulator YafY
MRADRLISILMLLQSRGKMSARQLANELEVSERTIHRDINALSIAGVPLYGEPGRDGGFALVDKYRTSLTGFNDGELKSLLMLSIPDPITELGLNQELRNALLKLSAALPDWRKGLDEHIRQRIHLDWKWWQQAETSLLHLQVIYQAVLKNLKVYIKYRPLITVELEHLVDPYGLVSKAGVWYLVCGHNQQTHVHQIPGLIDVRLTDNNCLRPDNFDLIGYWNSWCAKQIQVRKDYHVTVRVSLQFLPFMPLFLGIDIRSQIDQSKRPDPDGWTTLELSFESLEKARDRQLGFGNGVEVITPRALRMSIVDYAQQVITLYKRESGHKNSIQSE